MTSPSPLFGQVKLSELVPLLTGAENWQSWNNSMRWYLDAHNTKLYGLLVGKLKKPEPVATPAQDNPPETIAPPNAKAVKDWDTLSRSLMPLINATIHDNLKCWINSAENACDAYQKLRRVFASSSISTGLKKYRQYTSLMYNADNDDPQEFVSNFRTALQGASESCDHFSRTHPMLVYYQFLFAIGNSKYTYAWINSLDPDIPMSDAILEETYAKFITAELDRQVSPWYAYKASHESSCTSDITQYTHKTPCCHCHCHRRSTIHTTNKCSLDPANKNEANAATVVTNASANSTPAGTTTPAANAANLDLV